MKAALAPLGDPLIAFAVKANPNAAVLATLAAEGLGADVVSGGEYRRARAAGIAAEKIVFSGVGKTEAEMALALEGGLCQFNLESVPKPRCCPRSRWRWGGPRRSASASIPTSRREPRQDLDRRRRTTSSASRSTTRSPAYARAARSAGPRNQGSRGPYRQPAHQPRAARGGVRQGRRADRAICGRTGTTSAPPISAAGSASPTIRPRRRRRARRIMARWSAGSRAIGGCG